MIGFPICSISINLTLLLDCPREQGSPVFSAVFQIRYWQVQVWCVVIIPIATILFLFHVWRDFSTIQRVCPRIKTLMTAAVECQANSQSNWTIKHPKKIIILAGFGGFSHKILIVSNRPSSVNPFVINQQRPSMGVQWLKWQWLNWEKERTPRLCPLAPATGRFWFSEKNVHECQNLCHLCSRKKIGLQ